MTIIATAPSWAAITTAITALTGLVAGIGGLLVVINNLKAGRQEIKDVHTAVNNTAQKQNRRADQLTAALTGAGVEVPPRDPPEGDEKAPVTDVTGNTP
jgi:phage-related tail protein